jgi:hypothetical protein
MEPSRKGTAEFTSPTILMASADPQSDVEKDHFLMAGMDLRAALEETKMNKQTEEYNIFIELMKAPSNRLQVVFETFPNLDPRVLVGVSTFRRFDVTFRSNEM